ncbi:ABC transporter substrate-binding protein [Coriobacteriales bacterium OH1046]|nr:ABC transporter substrate-binding protein [Coriobacteriales bacterium OH1046]
MNKTLSRRDFLAASGVLAGVGLYGCSGGEGGTGGGTEGGAEGGEPAGVEGYDPELVAAAQAEGELVVIGTCEEPYIIAACDKFTELFGIKTSWQRLGGGEVLAKAQEENGNPSADVWFGGGCTSYVQAANDNLLMKYSPANLSHITSPNFTSTDGTWVGIYTGILGFLVNKEELEAKGIDAPQDWADLVDPKYQGLIWSSNYNTSSTAELIINTVIQKYGHDEGIQFLVDLDKNVVQYTKSGGGPSKYIGTGECTIGINFLHDGIYQIVDNGYDNIGLVSPSSGASYEVGASAGFEGCAHPNAAKLWLEYVLTPECVNQAQDVGSYQFLVIDNGKQPQIALDMGVDPTNVMDFDFADMMANTATYKEEVMAAIDPDGSDDRFKTE